MGLGTALNTGDLLTAALHNLKMENARDLSALGLLDQSGVGGQELLLAVSENLAADRTLTVIVNDADRTIDLGGALTLAAALTTVTAAVTLTANVAGSSVTLPASGTLATIGGTETLTSKTLTSPTINAATLSGTLAGTPTFSGNIVLSSGTLNLTAAAAYTLGTTDAFTLTIKTNAVDKLVFTTTLGQFAVKQTTADVTLAFSDPAAARTITFADPLGNDSVAYLAATQTFTNKTINGATLSGTLAGTPTLSGATYNIAAGAGFVIGTTDNNSITVKTNAVNKFAFTATLGQFTVFQTTANYTLAFSDPGGARTITIADPGGAATLAYINQAQTHSAAHTFSGGPTFSRAGLAATFTNSTDGASVQIAIFQGDRATMADNDAAYISLQLSDSAGNQDEGARITWQATTIADGATQDTDLVLSAVTNGALTEHLRLDGSANQMQASRPVYITVAANVLQAENTNDAASSQVAIFEGNRATPADNDAAYITLRLSDSAGNQDEGARITWQATTVADGATQDTDLLLSALVNNVLTTFVTLDGSASEAVIAQDLRLKSAGSLILQQATGNYTITWADPGAGRALSLADPGGADTFVFAAMTQTLTGKTISLAGNLTFASALDIVVQAATAVALELSNGATKLWAVDTRVAVDNVEVHTWTPPAPTIASANGTTWQHHNYAAVTITLTGGTGVTAMDGLQGYFDTPTLTSESATTVTTASTIYIRPPAAAGGGPVTITNNRMINTSVAGCFLTAAGVWTDACSEEHKTDIREINLVEVGRLLEDMEVVTYRRRDPSDGGFTRFGVIAERAPDCLADASHQGVAAQYLAGFAVSGLKYLQDQNRQLQERVDLLEKALNARN